MSRVSTPVLANRLPFDVLHNVFTEVVLKRGHKKEPLLTPLVLASVCAVWRNAALRTPRLWSKISICARGEDDSALARVRPHSITDIKFARTWIARSGVTPLYLYAHWCIGDSEGSVDSQRLRWAELLASVAHRLVFFYLSSSGTPLPEIPRGEFSILVRNPFPCLESLTFKAGIQAPELAPPIPTETITLRGLSRLRIARVSGPFSMPRGGGDLHRVEGMKLESLLLRLFVEDVRSTFDLWLTPQTCLSLRHLTIDHSHGWSCNSPPGSPRIELPNLAELRFRGFSRLCTGIFNHIFHLPALTTLRIEGQPSHSVQSAESGKDTVAYFLECMRFPHLQQFVLQDIKAIDDQLYTFLSLHPHLTSLGLCRVVFPKTMAPLSNCSRYANSMCPRLERLEITGFPTPSQYLTSNLDVLIRFRYTEAQPAELFSHTAKGFARLFSLIWNGVEKLPQPEGSRCDGQSDSLFLGAVSGSGGDNEDSSESEVGSGEDENEED